jgi:ech hydrogenase subunit B
MSLIQTLLGTVLFAVLAPVVGCLLAGADRIVSARMQGRVGPPLLQPYYDVRKLLGKEDVSVSGVDGLYMTCALVFTAFSGGFFFSGGNLLMSAFLITMAALFFIIAAYSSRSPFAEIGAGRESLQVMAYEPMVILMAVAFYLATGTFQVAGVFDLSHPIICTIWLAFIGFLFILTIKLRKSPFDLSSSHHAHQELVKGVTTEMSGRTLAKVEVMHWCETVLFLGWTGMFFVWGGPTTLIVGVVFALLAWFLEILIDNNFARVKWQAMLKSAWIVALVCGGVNIAVLMLL